MSSQFHYQTIASPLHSEGRLAAICQAYEPILAAAGGIPADETGSASAQPMVYVILTGGTEQEVLRRRADRPRSEPAVLLAHPDHNSLPAALEVLARLQQDGQAGRIVFLNGPDDVAGRQSLDEAVRCAGVAVALRAARLGVVGQPSDWLVASVPDPAVIHRRWGPTQVDIPMTEVHRRLAIAKPKTMTHAPDLRDQARKVVEPSAADLDRAAGVYDTLLGLVSEYRLDALTMRCFDLVTAAGTTGCLALARLNDEGVPAGCEGDIPAALGLLWAFRLTGNPAWMANPARVDPDTGRLTLAHCTVPTSLVAGYALRSHFESGLGAAIQGDFPPGDVTLFRIGGRNLDILWMAEGSILAATHEEGLCRTQAMIGTAPEPVRELLERPAGNHVILVPGRWRRLLEASRAMIIPVVGTDNPKFRN